MQRNRIINYLSIFADFSKVRRSIRALQKIRIRSNEKFTQIRAKSKSNQKIKQLYMLNLKERRRMTQYAMIIIQLPAVHAMRGNGQLACSSRDQVTCNFTSNIRCFHVE